MTKNVSDLNSSYREIEERLDWPTKPTGIGKGDQFYRLVTDLKSKVRDRSLTEKLEPSTYEDRLYKLPEFVSDLRDALNHYSFNTADEKKNEQLVWYHRSDNQITGLGTKKDDEPEIYRESLLEAAASYLANPSLQHDQIDWIFIDSLIFAEISAYRESILSGQALGKTNWGYVFSGGDVEKIYWFQLKKAFGFFALRYIVPPAVIFALYYFQYEAASAITGVVYAAYLLLHVALWPLRHRKRKVEQKTLQEHTDRLQKMINTYYYCKPPIVSLGTLRSYLNKAVEAGAIFDGALFSLLKRVEETRGEAFMPFAKST
jgi:hypothetical protein